MTTYPEIHSYIFEFIVLTFYLDYTPKRCIMCVEYILGGVVMRTNIVIDDKLLEEAFSVSIARTKKDLIHEALREFILLKKRKDLTELAGSIKFHKGYNHKKLRKMRK